MFIHARMFQLLLWFWILGFAYAFGRYILFHDIEQLMFKRLRYFFVVFTNR